MCGLIETGYFETQSQKYFEDKEVPVRVSQSTSGRLKVTNKNDMVVRNKKIA